MKRTQIYLDKPLFLDISTGAKLHNITISEYIRRMLKKSLYQTVRFIPIKKGKSLSSIADHAVSFGKKNLAREFDHYLEESIV